MLGTTDTLTAEHSTFRGTVQKVIESALEGSGIRTAKIEMDPTPAQEKLRVWIVSDEFNRFTIAERQDMIWRALNSRFPLSELVKIGMVFTLTPKEFDDPGNHSLEGVVIEGRDGLKCEIVREVDLGYGYAGHGTSQTSLFIVKPSQSQPFAVYVSYSEVFMIAYGWTSIDRWGKARDEVQKFLAERNAQDIVADKSPDGRWQRVTDPGWELWVR